MAIARKPRRDAPVKLQSMVADPSSKRPGRKLVGWECRNEDLFLDGPVSRRVAILDFDEVTGQLLPGARYVAPRPESVFPHYDIADQNDVYARDFNQVSVFTTVLKTIDMFEDPDLLGRKVIWAFDGPQLLVVPRAGEWANAFYERDTRSLQFFYFKSVRDRTRTVYTSLAPDIVAHETAHAILDGIAPDLLHAMTPQSLAMHEAIADLCALIMAYRTPPLVKDVLSRTNGSIQDSSEFGWIGKEFGQALGDRPRGYLRSFANDLSLRIGSGRMVAKDEPHELSQVMSGALYSVMLKMHAADVKRLATAMGKTEREVSGKALFTARERFKRLILRALDYLPPGEISFSDYGRAIIAADTASHPKDVQEREWIKAEFCGRGIVDDPTELDPAPPTLAQLPKHIDLDTLGSSDWYAYDFVNNHRELLHVPPDIPFQVRPRLTVTKKYYFGSGKTLDVPELLLKVSWDETEENRLGRGIPTRRRITVGSMLALDANTQAVRALLSTASGARRPAEQAQLVADRTGFAERLLDRGYLHIGHHHIGPDNRPLQTGVSAEIQHGLMRVRNTARLLHLTGCDDDDRSDDC